MPQKTYAECLELQARKNVLIAEINVHNQQATWHENQAASKSDELSDVQAELDAGCDPFPPPSPPSPPSPPPPPGP